VSDHETVLITGASSGIGRETALCYARRGARVVLVSRSRDALEKTAAECAEAGAVDTLVAVTDVGDREQVQRAFDEAIARFAGVDVVVSSAGVVAYGLFTEVPPEVFDGVVQTNVLGNANVARVALRHFRDRARGSLVLVGSILGKATAPYMSAYVVSKFAVTGLARVLRQEMRDVPGVRVHGVFPGGVNTPIYDQAANYLGTAGRPPPPVDDPGRVAAAILRVVDERGGDVSPGLGNPLILAGFRLLPAVYDLLVGPLMRLISLSGDPVEQSPGNVLAPKPAGEASRGPHGRFARS